MADSGARDDRDAGGSRSARPGSGPARPGWVLPAAVALGVALVALVVFAVFFGIKVVGGFAQEHGRDSALSAGQAVAKDLTTFDYTSAEQDVARLHERTIPNFANGFVDDPKAFVKYLRDNKVKMSGEVTGAGLASYDGNAAHVLVTVRSTVASEKTPQPQLRDYRLDVSLIQQGGDWVAQSAGFVS